MSDSMRLARTLVKILAASAVWGCASSAAPPSRLGSPSPGTREAELRAAEEQLGTRVVYLGELALPGGPAEYFQVGEHGLLLHLPAPGAHLVVVGTARRFVGADGDALPLAEREVCTELWRVGLDDPRRRRLHAVGATLSQHRSGAGLAELVLVPARHPESRPAEVLATLARAYRPPPEALLERVLSRWERPRSGVERARQASLELGLGSPPEDPSHALGAVVAHPEGLSRLRRDASADVILIMGPVDRWSALTAAVGWLGGARPPARPPPLEGLRPTGAAPEGASGPAPRFLVRFPLPPSGANPALAELAGPALAALWTDPAELRLQAVHLERRDPMPSLDLVLELAATTSVSAAPSHLERALDAATSLRLDAAQRAALAEAAEARRRERLEPELGRATALILAALEGTLEVATRPVARPRPHALETWLRSTLISSHARWIPIEGERAERGEPTRDPIGERIDALLGAGGPPREDRAGGRRPRILVLDEPGLEHVEIGVVLTGTATLPAASTRALGVALGDGPPSLLGRGLTAKVSEPALSSLALEAASSLGLALRLRSAPEELTPIVKSTLELLRALDRHGLSPADLTVAQVRAPDWARLQAATGRRRAGRRPDRSSDPVAGRLIEAETATTDQLRAAARALSRPSGLRLILHADAKPELLAELARLLPSGEIELARLE